MVFDRNQQTFVITEAYFHVVNHFIQHVQEGLFIEEKVLT